MKIRVFAGTLCGSPTASAFDSRRREHYP